MRQLRPAEVVAVSAAWGEAEAWAAERFDPSAMKREAVYPDIWDEEDVWEMCLRPHLQGLAISRSASD